MIENSAGTIRIPVEDAYAVDGLDRGLTELGVRARAFRADPHCSAPVEEVDWVDQYRQIVPENGPDPWITIQPSAIPEDNVLLLVAQDMPELPSGQRTGLRLLLVPSPAPERIGKVFYPPKPPPARQ